MSEVRTNTYEGMFLFPHAAVSNMQAAVDHIKEILGHAEAELLSMRKWDERRLAYEIKGNKRGLYFLTYFKANSDKLAVIERDCNLSEQLLRHMVTRAEHITQETIESMEGQKELADEIKLRAEKGEEREDTSSVQVASDDESSDESDSGVENETTADTESETPEPVAAVEG